MTRWQSHSLIAVAVVVTIVGGSALYVRSRVKSGLEAMTNALSPFVDFRYEGVSVSPGGTVRVSRIELRPRTIPDVVTADSFVVQTPGLWFLMTGIDDMGKGEFPEMMDFSVNNLTVSLDGGLARRFDDFVKEVVAATGAPPISNCGDVRYFDLGVYRKLGYGALSLDMSTGYRTARGGGMNVTTRVRAHDMGAVIFQSELSGSGLDAMRRMTTPRRFSVNYSDLSLVERVKNFCAQANGMDVAQYIEAEVNRSNALYSRYWGFVPGPGLRDAYRDFLTTPGELEVEGTVPDDTDLQALHLFDPNDIVAMMGLRVRVNGKPIEDLSVAAFDPESEPATPPSSAPAPAQTAAAPAVTRAATAPAPTAKGARLKIAPDELHRYIGKAVRITTHKGSVREGNLLHIRAGVARLERRFGGSDSVVIAIPLSDIASAEVR